MFLYYYDKSPSPLENGEDGVVIIRDGRNGSLETVTTNADGETVRVQVDSVDTDDFMDYLLSVGRITEKQRIDYDRYQTLTISFAAAADAMDFFDWSHSNNDAFPTDSLGIDEQDIDYIRKELPPLSSFGD